MNSDKAQFYRLNAMVWVCFIFVAGFVIVRQVRHLPPGPMVVYPLLFIGFLSVLARTYFGARRPEGVFTFTPWITLMDIFIIALGMYVTGGKSSGLWLLYFPLLVSEMFTAGKQHVVWMLGLVAVLHTLAFLPLKAVDDYGRLFTQLFFLMAVAGIARSVNGAHLKRERELASLREKVSLADERQRIAREFHDGLGHTLVNAVLGLEVAKKMVTRDPNETYEMLDDQGRLLREALDEMRYVVWQMQPSNEMRGLVARVKLFAKQLEERASVQVQTELPDDTLTLPPAIEVMFARVIQESLSNIAKHAQKVSKVEICLRVKDEQLEAIIEDDGGGFEQDKVIGGFGLQNMRERLEAIGGRFIIESAPGKGTIVTARAPLQVEQSVPV